MNILAPVWFPIHIRYTIFIYHPYWVLAFGYRPYTTSLIPLSVYYPLFTLFHLIPVSLPCEVRWATPATRPAFHRRLLATSTFDHCPPESRLLRIGFPIWVPAICPPPPLIRDSSLLTSDRDPLRSIIPDPVAPAVNISPPPRLASLCGAVRSRRRRATVRMIAAAKNPAGL